MMYGEYGHRMINKLWEETMDELSFAGVDEILQQLKH
jgi:hypothetical protein